MFKEFGGKYTTDSIRKYDDVKNICNSVTAGVKFIKSCKALPTIESIYLAKESLLCLEFHRNLNFVKMFLDICAVNIPLHKFKGQVLDDVDGT